MSAGIRGWRRNITPRFVMAALGSSVTFAVAAAAGLGIVIGSSSPTPGQLLAMAGHKGATTIATVKSVDVTNHNTCNYTYTVAGKTYSVANSCSATQGDQTIRVWYLRSNPSLETDQNPRSAAISLLTLPVVVALFLAAIVALLIVQGGRLIDLMGERRSD